MFSVPRAAKSPMKMLYIYAGCRAMESSLQDGVSIFSVRNICAISAGTGRFWSSVSKTVSWAEKKGLSPSMVGPQFDECLVCFQALGSLGKI